MGHYTHHFLQRAGERIGLSEEAAGALADRMAAAIEAGDETWCRFQAQHTKGSKIFRVDLEAGRYWIVVSMLSLCCITVLTSQQPMAVRRKGKMRKTFSGGPNGCKGKGMSRR